jgi:hypothetical protein
LGVDNRPLVFYACHHGATVLDLDVEVKLSAATPDKLGAGD